MVAIRNLPRSRVSDRPWHNPVSTERRYLEIHCVGSYSPTCDYRNRSLPRDMQRLCEDGSINQWRQRIGWPRLTHKDQSRLPQHPCMRVRTGRFRSGDQVTPVARCNTMTTSPAPHASHPGLPASHSPILDQCGHLQPGGRVPADRFSPSRESRLPVSSFQRAIPRPRLAVPLLWRLLTSQGISALGSPQIRACCFPIRPPHLPPWLNQGLCCVVPTRPAAAASPLEAG